MVKVYYGLTRQSQIFEMIEDVCNDLKGQGEDIKATIELMISTIGQETHLGEYKDPTRYAHGTGLAQIDPSIPFDDIVNRSTRFHKLILQKYNIDIKSLKHRDLEVSPLLSIILCRLKYKLVPAAIPSDSVGQWLYYKKWYNSYLGKATSEEFFRNREKSLKKYNVWKRGN